MASAPPTTNTTATHVAVLVAGIMPVTSVKPRAFLSSTAGLMSVSAPMRVAPLPRETINSCSGTSAAYASRIPMPVAAGAATLRPMNSTPISVPIEMLATRRPGAHISNLRSSSGIGTCARYTARIGSSAT
jgi:hypothetical protein